MADAYPLSWPEGWPRTQWNRRTKSRFQTTFERSRDGLLKELRLLGVKMSTVVISSWLPLRRDGLPYADQARRRLEDPGVAVYFMLRGKQMVMARDAYDTPFDNLHSLKIAIQHLRGLERHGGATMMERAFEGFAALPEPGNASHRAPWWKILGFPEKPSRSDHAGQALAIAEKFYRDKARAAHPDAGGTHEQMADLNTAIQTARQELRA